MHCDSAAWRACGDMLRISAFGAMESSEQTRTPSSIRERQQSLMSMHESGVALMDVVLVTWCAERLKALQLSASGFRAQRFGAEGLRA